MFRKRLPNRRGAETFDVICHGSKFTATIGRFADGRPAEIFMRGEKADSATDTAAKDAAVVCSLALQHGVPIEVIRKALLRSPNGTAASPLGEALDRLETHGHATQVVRPSPH
jgi:ribonucleoside-diphosphate reductase alpha chain